MNAETSDKRDDPTVREQSTKDASTATETLDSGKAGAPKGNRNALKHALSSGLLPSGCAHIVKQSSSFRRAVEAATLHSSLLKFSGI